MNLLISLMLATVTITTPTIPVDATTRSAAGEKTPIFLQIDAPDPVGATYVATLRQVLHTSKRYRPVINPAEARFIVGIVTIDPHEAESGSAAGRSTAAAVTLRQEGDQFVYSWVIVVTRQNVGSLASELIAAIDKEIQGFGGVSRP